MVPSRIRQARLLSRGPPSPLISTQTASNWDAQNKKALRITRRAPAAVSSAAGLVGAAREKGDQHHQIRQRKQPLVCLDPGAFRSPRDETQMTALRKIVDVIDANP